MPATPSVTGTVVSNLPLTSATLYVRLGSLTSQGWTYNDYTVTSGAATNLATLISPAPFSVLADGTTSATFQWTAGTGVGQYGLTVGTTGPGSANVYRMS